jgi:hypothetical protein
MADLSNSNSIKLPSDYAKGEKDARSDSVKCPDFPCLGIRKDRYVVPGIDMDPGTITVVMVSESPPENKSDYFYKPENGSYSQTIIQAFRDAGLNISEIQDVLKL